MDSQNTSAPPRARSAAPGNRPHGGANPRPTQGHLRSVGHPSGVVHDNTRHTTRFTVVGNHLAQHPELSLLAIGLAVHIQSVPAGAHIDIRTLAERFPEGTTRIAAALRELEVHGYLRRLRERTPAGQIVTRTISCNQPVMARPGTARPLPSPHPRPVRPVAPAPAVAEPAPLPQGSSPDADVHPTTVTEQPIPRKRHALPAVPQPAFAASALLQTATDVLAGLCHHDPRLLLSAPDTAHLSPGVAAWLEREVPPTAIRLALTSDLPPEGLRRPAALLAHRLTAQLPPPPPFRAPVTPPPVRHPLQNCDKCDHAFRAPAPGRCGGCRDNAPWAGGTAGHTVSTSHHRNAVRS